MPDSDGESVPPSPHQRARPKGRNIGRDWGQRALKKEGEWGIQHPHELLSAINEEVGEIEQAYLEATHESGDEGAVQDEIDDLGPLLMQLVESLRTHPLAFEPLATRQEVDDV